MFDSIKSDARYYLYEVHRISLDSDYSPIEAVRYDKVGGRSTRISRPTEKLVAVAGIDKSVLDSIDKQKPERHRWMLLVNRLEDTLSERQRMILTVWREPKRKGQTRESICYKKYGTTCAHSTMAAVIELLIERLAGMYFAMKIN